MSILFKNIYDTINRNFFDACLKKDADINVIKLRAQSKILKNILIVDDEKSIRSFSKNLLKTSNQLLIFSLLMKRTAALFLPMSFIE